MEGINSVTGDKEMWPFMVRHSVCETLWAWLKTVVSSQTLNFKCMLLVMRGGSWNPIDSLSLGKRSRSALVLYKTLWTRYRLQVLSNHFQTWDVSCGWWEEERNWFWVTGSKVKVNFGTPLCLPSNLEGMKRTKGFVNHFQTLLISCWWWE